MRLGTGVPPITSSAFVSFAVLAEVFVVDGSALALLVVVMPIRSSLRSVERFPRVLRRYFAGARKAV